MKKNSKFLSIMLATALGAAAFGGGLALKAGKVTADETKTYDPSRIFTASLNTASAKRGEEDADKDKLVFSVKKGGNVAFKRDLALKWFAKDKETDVVSARYFSTEFTLKDPALTGVKSVTFALETAPAASLKEKKAVNKLVFEKTEAGIEAKVNDGEPVALASNVLADKIALSLAEEYNGEVAAEGEFFVLLNGDSVGRFTNVGANFAEYYSDTATTPMVPFAVSAEFEEPSEDATEEEKKAAENASLDLYMHSLNGQSFALNADGQVTDNALPVLVVNDEITSFTLGAAFSLDYEVLDILDTSVDKTLQYYQYNPTDEIEEGKTFSDLYKTLTTSTYFYDTVYEKDGEKHSVYKEKGMEFVSVRMKLGDDTHSKDDEKEIYELVWYAESGKAVKPDTGDDFDIDYIEVSKNKKGAYYTFIKENPENGESVIDEEKAALIEDYQNLVTEKAQDVNAGNNAYVYLPSLNLLIKDDDTGYQGLKFSIYYKTKSSSSASSSTSLSYDELRIPVESEGPYEFKVLATDKSGNSMYCYRDGELTKVDSSSIWEIDAIPSFHFNISGSKIDVDDERESNRNDLGYLDKTYTLSSFEVTGLSGYGEEYGLYYMDMVAFTELATEFNAKNMRSGVFSDISYESINSRAVIADAENEDYVGYFAKLYARRLAEVIEVNDVDGFVTKLLTEQDGNKPIFRKINEYDSSINEDKHKADWNASDNKYHWDASAKSFKPMDTGTYVAFGVFTDSLRFGDKVSAYKAIEVEADQDRISGETEWLKNNIASVVLFSIAAVLLIIVIILFLVKPSDETLEDVDEAVADKKAAKKRKAKKE